MKTLYVSIDIEADGPIPGRNSMLSLGTAVFDLQNADPRVPIDLYETNLIPLPEATPDKDTMAWWQHPEQAQAWAYVNQNRRAPEIAMTQFKGWLEDLQITWKAKLVFVGYPATYDFMFTYWYLVRFTGFPAPFGFQGLDIKTLAATKLGIPFQEAAKRNFPKKWFEGINQPHTHKAIDDAVEQGILFVNIMNHPPCLAQTRNHRIRPRPT